MVQLTLKDMATKTSRLNPKLFSFSQLSFPTDTHRPSLRKSILTPLDILPPQTQQFRLPPLASPLMSMRAEMVSPSHLCTCSVTAQIDGCPCTVPRTQSLFHM